MTTIPSDEKVSPLGIPSESSGLINNTTKMNCLKISIVACTIFGAIAAFVLLPIVHASILSTVILISGTLLYKYGTCASSSAVGQKILAIPAQESKSEHTSSSPPKSPVTKPSPNDTSNSSPSTPPPSDQTDEFSDTESFDSCFSKILSNPSEEKSKDSNASSSQSAVTVVHKYLNGNSKSSDSPLGWEITPSSEDPERPEDNPTDGNPQENLLDRFNAVSDETK